MSHTKANGGRNWEVNCDTAMSDKVLVHAHPKRIALCYKSEKEGLYPTRIEAIANAKLIAAAPDLLGELSGVIGFFNLDTYKEGTPEFDYCQRIKKAIDKATK